MKKNAFWIIFLTLVALFSLWFVAKASYSVISYFNLTVQNPTKIEKWSVEEKKSDQFAVKAHYSFVYNGKEYRGVSPVGRLYPNPWAAERAKAQFAKQEWPVWLDPKHPERAVLIKRFPFKKIASSAILIGLLIYFIFLSFYVKVGSRSSRLK